MKRYIGVSTAVGRRYLHAKDSSRIGRCAMYAELLRRRGIAHVKPPVGGMRRAIKRRKRLARHAEQVECA